MCCVRGRHCDLHMEVGGGSRGGDQRRGFPLGGGGGGGKVREGSLAIGRRGGEGVGSRIDMRPISHVGGKAGAVLGG